MSGLERFKEYFRRNYPGPNTIIAKPDWHAPKIYAAAIAASAHDELLEACQAVVREIEDDEQSERSLQRMARAYDLCRAAIAKAEGAQ